MPRINRLLFFSGVDNFLSHPRSCPAIRFHKVARSLSSKQSDLETAPFLLYSILPLRHSTHLPEAQYVLQRHQWRILCALAVPQGGLSKTCGPSAKYDF